MGGCRHFRVVYTRPTWAGCIMRRRECRNCGRRMTAREKGGGVRGLRLIPGDEVG